MSQQYPGGFISKAPPTPQGNTAGSSAYGIWDLSQQAYYQAQGLWPDPNNPSDPQFNYVTALLHGDGTNGAAVGGSYTSSATPFTKDASSNAYVVKPINNAQENAFTPYQGNYYGASFNGSSSFLYTTVGSIFDLSGDFTVEAWVNVSATNPGYAGIFGNGDYASTAQVAFGVNSNTPFLFVSNGSGWAVPLSSSVNVVYGTWNHIAATCASNVFTIWLNGVSVATATYSGTRATPTTTAVVGRLYSTTSSNYFPGFLSNVRVVKGTAVYTTTFTPSTTPLTAISGTSLLTCQNNTFIDNSSYASALTVSGSAAISSYQPFTLPTTTATYGSAALNGGGAYVTSSSITFNPRTTAFTVEGWYYARSGTTYCLFGSASSTQFYVSVSSGNFYVGDGSINTISAAGTVGPLNTWQYIAMSFDGTTYRLYQNGTLIGSGTTLLASNTVTLAIGAYSSGTSSVAGFMSDVRYSTTARYTGSTMTVPTTLLTSDANTALLTLQYNGAVNNIGFVDSSPNNFNVLCYTAGSLGAAWPTGPNAGSFGPYGSNWSNYFDGSGDYLSTPSSTPLTLGSGDFTIEAWVNISGTNSNVSAAIISKYSSTNTDWMLRLTRSGSTYDGIEFDGGGSGWSATYAFNFGTWYHVAVVRNGTSLRFYVNGVDIGGATVSFTLASSSEPVRIGEIDYSGYYYYWYGYISNVRVVKGTAVYTGNFTPSTTPLTAISGTALLTCQSNSFKDNSVNAAVITAYGNSSVQSFTPFGATTAYSPAVNGSSVYFSGSYYSPSGVSSWNSLEVANTAALRFGTSQDFTIECWANLPGTQYSCLMTQSVVDEGTGNNVGWYLSVNTDKTVSFGQGGSNYITPPSIPAFNSWFHIALVRYSGTTTIYINGVSSGSTSSSINMSSGPDVRSDTPFMIGCIEHYYWYGCAGYISDVRVANKALYTGAFTPNTTPLTAVGGTQLLLNMNTEAIYDNAKINNFITVNDAKISTSVKKYGTGSLAFDGTGDYLAAPYNSNMNLGSGNFTIEYWVYFNSTANNQEPANGNNGSALNWAFNTVSGNLTYYLSASGTSYDIASAVSMGSITSGQWIHVALVRNGSTFTPYLNGVAGTTTTSSSAIYDPQLPTYIGGIPAGYGLNGYIDDFRITKGYARYTTNFTPPTAAFPNIGPN